MTTPPLPPPRPIGRFAETDLASQWSPWPVASLLSGMTLGTFLFFLLVLPRYLQIWKDFKVDLPRTTSFVGDLGFIMFSGSPRFEISCTLWVVTVVGVFFISYLTTPAVPVPSRPATRKRLGILVCVLIVVIPAFVAIVIIVPPEIARMQSVSGPQKR